jgi:hypothetical protein
MRAQGYTEEEIEDMLKADREIDQGADLFPLDPELEKGAKKARRADRTDTPKKANRAEDTDKRTIILLLASALGCVRTEDIVNPEREFSFMWNGKRYKVVLSVPRGQ